MRLKIENESRPNKMEKICFAQKSRIESYQEICQTTLQTTNTVKKYGVFDVSLLVFSQSFNLDFHDDILYMRGNLLQKFVGLKK
jgi:hypothetical protein